MDVWIVTTGGTFDKIYFDAKSRFEIGDSMVPALLGEAGVTFDYEVVEALRKDSLEIEDADRAEIARCIAGLPPGPVVVIHGTDTMAETAQWLARDADRTIVLTGAMQPARMRRTDAPFNLAFAIACARLLPGGVHVAIQGQLFAAGTVRKNREAGRFERLPNAE